MKAPAFSPGHFKPVVEVSQSDTGLPAPVDTDFSGLGEAVATTLDVANASARGYGAVLPSTISNANIGKVIGYVLACKNLVEQLGFLQVHARVSSPLRQSPVTLEPIVRFYNYFGHFEADGKIFVARGARDALVQNLFHLRLWTHPKMIERASNLIRCTLDEFKSIDLSFYGLTDSGDVGFTTTIGLKAYLVKLATALLAHDFNVDLKIPMVRMVFDISSEEALAALLRRIRFELTTFEPPSREREDRPTKEHKAAMKKLFNGEYSESGDLIPVVRFSEAIGSAYRLLMEVTQERSYVMKAMAFPKYEGGTASQLAELTDDVLYSERSLSLGESTVAVALSQSYGSRALYRCAPNVGREETRRALCAQSLINAK